MRDDYRVFVHTEALDVLPKSGRRRETVIAFLRDLGHRWSLGGDYKEEEPQTGRSVNVTEIMGFAVTW